MVDLSLESNVFLEKFKGKSIMLSVDKDTNVLDNNKAAVVTISSKDSDKFEGHSKGSTGWFNLYHFFI